MAEDVAPDGWDVPVEPGLIVELHSLSRDDLNGRQGEALEWDKSKERWGIKLAYNNSFLSVRPANLKRAPPVTEQVREKAFTKAQEAGEFLARVRAGACPRAEFPTYLKRAEKLLQAAPGGPGAAWSSQQQLFFSDFF